MIDACCFKEVFGEILGSIMYHIGVTCRIFDRFMYLSYTK